MRRHAGGRRCGARGREGTLLAPPGGPGQPSVPTTRDRPSVGWTRRGRRRAKACRIGGPRGPRRRPEATAPGTEIAAMERREAPAFLATGTRQDGKTGAPLGAPSPRFFARGKSWSPQSAGKDDGAPRAAKNRGGGALAILRLILRSIAKRCVSKDRRPGPPDLGFTRDRHVRCASRL